jgi:hypothetical protein
MIRRVVGSTMVLAVVLMAGESMFAAPLTALHVPVQAMGKQKEMVTFHLRNDSKNELIVKAGSQQVTLEPGKPVDVTLKVGETVTVSKGTSSFPEGTVVATASQDLKDSTIALR